MHLLIDVCKKFNIILSKHQKIRILELVVLMIIGGALETLSVTVIMPFMEVILEPSRIMNKELVVRICTTLGINSDRTFLVLLALVIAFMYILKNLFLLGEYNLQYRFVYNNRFLLQKRLLHTVLQRPYQYFLNASSGDILRLVDRDVESSFDVLINLLNLFTELVVSVMLIMTILIVSPVITLSIAGVLLCLMFVIYRFVRPRQNESGRLSQMASTGKNNWLLQSIQGIKEIKVNYKEKFFEDKYDYYGTIYNNAVRRSVLLINTPKLFIEAISMATMFIVIAILLYMGGDFEVIVPTLTVVAMAAIRILPSVNRISFTMSNVAFQKPRLDTFTDNLMNIDKYSGADALRSMNVDKGEIGSFGDAIRLNDVTFAYDEGARDVLSSASLAIKKGESVGIVGESGSGKTTAVDLILGLLYPQSGKILVDGIDIHADIHGWLSQVGYIPQMIFMLDGSIRDNVVFGEPVDDSTDEKVWRALEEASMMEFVKGLPEGLDTQIGERGVRISGGQRQRIGIARTLFKDPKVLVFDEATSALDNETENSIMESVNKLQGQKTMIIIAHRLTTIESCDHIYRVTDGKFIKER